MNSTGNDDGTTTPTPGTSTTSTYYSSASSPKASSSTAGVFPTDDDKRFMQWLADNGATFSGKSVYSFVDVGGDGDNATGATGAAGGRGLFAKDNVTNGDVVFTVPPSAALLVPSSRAGPMLNRLAGINPEWALAAMLIRETRLVRLRPNTRGGKVTQGFVGHPSSMYLMKTIRIYIYPYRLWADDAAPPDDGFIKRPDLTAVALSCRIIARQLANPIPRASPPISTLSSLFYADIHPRDLPLLAYPPPRLPRLRVRSRVTTLGLGNAQLARGTRRCGRR